MTEPQRGGQAETAVAPRQRTQRPRPWRVVLHNDDYTTMDFVVDVLVRHFAKSHAQALQVMLHVHRRGQGVAGVYSRDVAETKVAIVTEEARAEGMPLKATAEPERPGAQE